MQSEISITLRPFVPDDAPKMVALQARCLEISPDISLLPAGFYHGPKFEGGKNILCAVDANDEHVGHAMVVPGYISYRLDAWMLWMDVRADPDIANTESLHDTLLEKITGRAREIAARLDRRAMLYATYFAKGKSSIAYLKSKGFEHFESIYQMRRDLSQPLPDPLYPEGVEVREWRMETDAAVHRYIEAYNATFADQMLDVEELQHFMGADVWQDGTTISAFAGDNLVGSVMVYYQPDAAKNPNRVGATEYVFVHPDWRMRGIARYLLAQAMAYLKARGMAYASLEVQVENPRALSVYEAVGYTVHQEEVSLGKWLT
jgi:ribosomal protein S18 acetylase RimI-like enzyme